MEEKIINCSIYAPHKALFKSNRKDKAICKIIKCTNSDNCGLFKRNQCTYINVFNWQACPYGKYCPETGPTKAAKNYSTWLNEREEKYKDVRQKLSSFSNILALVGDYVFLPYSHMTMNEKVPFLAKGGFFLKENCFLKLEDFTIENIISIYQFRPQAMMGGEIESYQIEEVPKFIKHLSETFPDIYKKLCEKYPFIKKHEENYSYVGRKAILQTLTPNIGKFVDIHKAEWVWDGTYLTSTNSKASFMLVSAFSEIRIKPSKDEGVLITDNNQVNKDTKFLS